MQNIPEKKQLLSEFGCKEPTLKRVSGTAYYRRMRYDFSNSYWTNSSKSVLYSVRCV